MDEFLGMLLSDNAILGYLSVCHDDVNILVMVPCVVVVVIDLFQILPATFKFSSSFLHHAPLYPLGFCHVLIYGSPGMLSSCD